jgi:hypothetical protein
MTQTQLIDRFLEGIEPGTDLVSGLMGATHNRLRWIASSQQDTGRTLAFHNNGVVLLMPNNRTRRCKRISGDRESLVARRCHELGIPLGIWYPVGQLPGRKTTSLQPLMFRALDIGGIRPLEPVDLHMCFGKVLKYHMSHEDRMWTTYTVACTIAGIEPLFPSARELVDWYEASHQLL